jgi:Kdo2-lipid IVA lauroyltransferase/acyltransferase
MSRIFSWIGVGLIRLIGLSPFWLLYLLSDGLYFILYRLVGYRKKVVRQNLERSFPEKSATEIRALEIEFFHTLADIILESTKLYTLSEQEIKRRTLMIQNKEFTKITESKQNVCVVMGHYLNWEWFVLALPIYLQQKTYGVYKPLTNQVFDDLYFNMRSRFGMEMVPMRETFRSLKNHQDATRGFAVGLVADQTPSNVEQAYWGEFLNQDTPVFLGVEKAAKMFNAAVVFLDINKIKRGYYTFEMKVLTTTPNELPELAITKMHLAALEDKIKSAPAYWLWSHKRWKHKKPVI